MKDFSLEINAVLPGTKISCSASAGVQSAVHTGRAIKN